MTTALWTIADIEREEQTSGSGNGSTYQRPTISGSGFSGYEASRKINCPDKSELVGIIIECDNCKKQITLSKGTFEFGVEEARFASCSQLIESRILLDFGIQCPYCLNVIRDSIIVRDDLDLEDE